MWDTLIVLKPQKAHIYWEHSSLLSAPFAQSLYIKNLAFICTVASFLTRYCQDNNDKALCSRWLYDNVWSKRLMCDVWKLQVLVQVSLECPVDWLLYDTMVLNVDAWHLRGAVFAKRWRWCLCLTLGVSSSGHVLVYGRAVRLYHSAIFLYYGQLCTMTECELDSIGKDLLEQNKSGWDGLSKGLS